MANNPYLGGQQQPPHHMHPHHPHAFAAEEQQRFLLQQQQLQQQQQQQHQQQPYPSHPRSFPQQQQQQPYQHRRSSSNAHLAATAAPAPVRHPLLPVDHPMYHQQQQPYPQDPAAAIYPPEGNAPLPPHPYYHQQPHPQQQQYAFHHHQRSNSSSFSAPYPPPPYSQENAFPPSPRSIQSAPDQHSPRMDASRQPSMVPHLHPHPAQHPSRHYKTPSRSIDAQDLMVPHPPPPAGARMSPGPPMPPQPMQSSSSSPPFYPTRQPSQTLPYADPMQQQQQPLSDGGELPRHSMDRAFYPPPPPSSQQPLPYNPAEQEVWMERERLRHQQTQSTPQQQQPPPPHFQPDPRRGYMHEREYDRERSEHERMWAREQQMQQQQHVGPPATVPPPSQQQLQHQSQTAVQVPPPQEGVAQAHGRPMYPPQQQQQPLVHPSAEMQSTPHPPGSNNISPIPSHPPQAQDRIGGVPATPAAAPTLPSKSKHARQPSAGSGRVNTDPSQKPPPHRSSLGKRSIEQLGPLDPPAQLAPNLRTPASPPTTPPAPRFLSPDNEMSTAPLLQGTDHYQSSSAPPSHPSQQQASTRRSAEWMPPPAPIPDPGSASANSSSMPPQPYPTDMSTSPALPTEALLLKMEPGSAVAGATTPTVAEHGEAGASAATVPSSSTTTLTPPSPPSTDAPEMPNSKPLEGAFSCGECPKTYKTRTALLKHQWEHSPHWGIVDSDPDMSKHQQIQLMEAAQILLDMRSGRNL
ncbi:hypothetical protein BGZ73_006231 [Actinomortierella ambigua]|nr:hypothetical protein BGZ73_006231 [Actinomortierella ambigua]